MAIRFDKEKASDRDKDKEMFEKKSFGFFCRYSLYFKNSLIFEPDMESVCYHHNGKT